MRYRGSQFHQTCPKCNIDNHPIIVVYQTSTYSPSSALTLTQPPPISVSLSSEALPINDQQFTGIYVHVCAIVQYMHVHVSIEKGATTRNFDMYVLGGGGGDCLPRSLKEILNTALHMISIQDIHTITSTCTRTIHLSNTYFFHFWHFSRQKPTKICLTINTSHCINEN